MVFTWQVHTNSFLPLIADYVRAGAKAYPETIFFPAQVGHTKGYIQVLVIAPDSMLGASANVKVTSVRRRLW